MYHLGVGIEVFWDLDWRHQPAVFQAVFSERLLENTGSRCFHFVCPPACVDRHWKTWVPLLKELAIEGSKAFCSIFLKASIWHQSTQLPLPAPHSCTLLGETEARHGTDKSDVVCTSSLPSTKLPNGTLEQRRSAGRLPLSGPLSETSPTLPAASGGSISPFSSHPIHDQFRISLLWLFQFRMCCLRDDFLLWNGSLIMYWYIQKKKKIELQTFINMPLIW